MNFWTIMAVASFVFALAVPFLWLKAVGLFCAWEYFKWSCDE